MQTTFADFFACFIEDRFPEGIDAVHTGGVKAKRRPDDIPFLRVLD
ncbi:MAG: hypothetical protein ABR905_07780 [Terracidiphilus sp.]